MVVLWYIFKYYSSNRLFSSSSPIQIYISLISCIRNSCPGLIRKLWQRSNPQESKWNSDTWSRIRKNTWQLNTSRNHYAEHIGRAGEGEKCLRSLEHWDRGSNPIRDVNWCMYAFFLCLRCPVQVVSFRQGWFPVQGILPTLCKIYSYSLILNGNRPEDIIRQRKKMKRLYLQQLK
jgi:hypothetical protein